jgi:guanylate kinase
MVKGTLFIISAPSGAGKSTLLNRVMTQLPGVVFSISHTTRLPRKGEQDGREYHFVEKTAFVAMIEDGHFLEYANVHGNYYGTSRLAVQQQLEQGLDVILDIDVQGAKIIRDAGELDSVSIFLAPPDLTELERRLRGRGLDSDETISKRLRNATTELRALEEFDYLIVNEKLDDAVRMFESVILAERAKSHRHFTGKDIQKKVFFA